MVVQAGDEVMGDYMAHKKEAPTTAAETGGGHSRDSPTQEFLELCSAGNISETLAEASWKDYEVVARRYSLEVSLLFV